jgi:hypothetical protein
MMPDDSRFDHDRRRRIESETGTAFSSQGAAARRAEHFCPTAL